VLVVLLMRTVREEKRREEMSKKLFVGGLAWATDDKSLRAAFEEYGPVEEAKVVLDRDTGRSRGFGFVTFNDDDQAVKAIAGLNETQLDGRSIRVNEAENKPRGGRGRY